MSTTPPVRPPRPEPQTHQAAPGRRALLAGVLAAPLLLRLPFPRARADVPATGATSAADQAALQQIQTYLNSIRTLKARFLQIAPNGQQTQGTVWLERPGRMRFQYDKPSPLLLVAGHGLLVFHDAQLQQTSNIPLGQTPLGILLGDTVQLSGPVTLIGFRHLPGQYQVTVDRTASPGDGTLTIVLTDNPMTLRGWTVVDAQQRQTSVTLFDIQLGGRFEASLFDFVDPNAFQNNPGGGG